MNRSSAYEELAAAIAGLQEDISEFSEKVNGLVAETVTVTNGINETLCSQTRDIRQMTQDLHNTRGTWRSSPAVSGPVHNVKHERAAPGGRIHRRPQDNYFRAWYE